MRGGRGGRVEEKGTGSEALIHPRRLEHLAQEREVRPDHDQRNILDGIIFAESEE
jgi:hypothetical protein